MQGEDSLADFASRMRQIIQNRQAFPQDELRKYAGQCVAWSPDGSAIVASAADFETLDQIVKTGGHDPSRCTYEYLAGESVL